MGKHIHEIRDPIHVFVRLDSDERAVLDSRPFQLQANREAIICEQKED